MNMYSQQYSSYLARVEEIWPALMRVCFTEEENSRVAQAAAYSLLGGGKRVRAVLCLAVCDLLAGNRAAAERYAGAVEMLHCYSLIHDDLPCMDNDDFRRGKPSCHKVWGEDTALLAGDALLTAAFEVTACAPGDPAQNMRAVQILSRAAGPRGMVYGQELDLRFEAGGADEAQLTLLHRNKTGMLINAAVQMGAAACETAECQRRALEQFAFAIGLVFQIVDDILDVTSSADILGKPIGSDEANGKTTFVTLFGTDGSQEKARLLTQQACQALHNEFGEKSAFLEAFAVSLLKRDH